MTVEPKVKGVRVLVTGATGKLGQWLVPRLLEQGVRVRALSRQPDRARGRWGVAVEVAYGDLADPISLNVALQGVTHLFLLSPIDPLLAHYQIRAIEAAERGEVQRIVKLSGSAWTLDSPGRSLSGDLHREVEQRLALSPIAHVVLQPNAWAQVALGRLTAPGPGEEGAWTDPFAGAAVSYIDVRDIADVAVAALLESATHAPDAGQPWVLTGPQALRFMELAARASALWERRIKVHPAEAGLSPSSPGPGPAQQHLFVERVHVQFRELLRAGIAASVTTTVADVLGRPARPIEDFFSSTVLPV